MVSHTLDPTQKTNNFEALKNNLANPVRIKYSSLDSASSGIPSDVKVISPHIEITSLLQHARFKRIFSQKKLRGLFFK